MTHSRPIATISAAAARDLTDAAAAAAAEIGVPMCIAVTCTAGHLIHFLRMDGAPLLSTDIAINWKKHRNSVRQQMATVGTPSMLSGITGSLARRSCQTNNTRPTRPATSRPIVCGSSGEWPWPSRVRNTSTPDNPPPNSSEPR